MKLITTAFFLILGFLSFSATRYVTNTNDSGVGSLRDAITSASDGDVIEIDSNLIIANSDTIELNSQILIDNDITVLGATYSGNNVLYISGKNTNRIFMINSSSVVVLNGLNIINARGTGAGGAILVNPGMLTVLNSSFDYCRATTGSGGAIHGSTITVSGSTFTGCSANSNSGGAISGNIVTVTNSLLDDNSAKNGGAISAGEVTVENSTLSNNTTSDYGGAVYSSSRVTINYSTLNNNHGSDGGGAICTSRSTSSNLATSLYSYVYITASTLYGNTSNNGGTAIRSYLYATNNSTHFTSAIVDVKYSTIMDFGSATRPAIQVVSDDNGDIRLRGSILYKTSGTTVVNQYESVKIISSGYNILSDSVSGTSSTDQLYINGGQLDLGPLAYNGGDTKTALPSFNSVAYNNGYPSGSLAQNGSIIMTREVGAAEIRAYSSTDVQFACDSIVWMNGVTYYASNNTAKDTLMATDGLDSIIYLDLTIQSSYSILNDTICSNDSLFFNEVFVSAEGQYFDTLVNENLCDSVIELNLIVLAVSNTQLYDTIYSFDSVLFAGNYLNVNGDYFDTLINTNGCDSIITFSLTVNQASLNYVNDTICSTDSLFFGNKYLSADGVYTDTLLDIQNNDSIVVLSLVTAYCPVYDSCSGLFISEYIEGSSSNKVIELYNASPMPIDLAAYKLKRYSNGDTTGVVINLTGIIQSYGTFVIANPSSNSSILALADATSGLLNFNGDDAVSLERNDSLIDLIGVIGQDPGTQWGNGTQNHTLRRKPSIVGGVKVNPVSFDPATEWDILAIDEINFLGVHSSNCAQTTSIETSYVANISLFPNPASSIVNLASNDNVTYSYTLLSPNGKIVKQSSFVNRGEINVSELNNGIYILSIRGETNIVNKRVVVSH